MQQVKSVARIRAPNRMRVNLRQATFNSGEGRMKCDSEDNIEALGTARCRGHTQGIRE